MILIIDCVLKKKAPKSSETHSLFLSSKAVTMLVSQGKFGASGHFLAQNPLSPQVLSFTTGLGGALSLCVLSLARYSWGKQLLLQQAMKDIKVILQIPLSFNMFFWRTFTVPSREGCRQCRPIFCCPVHSTDWLWVRWLKEVAAMPCTQQACDPTALSL